MINKVTLYLICILANFQVMISTISSIIIYFWIRLNANDVAHFFIFYCYTIILVLAVTGFGFIGGTLFLAKEVEIVLFPLFTLPMILFLFLSNSK